MTMIRDEKSSIGFVKDTGGLTVIYQLGWMRDYKHLSESHFVFSAQTLFTFSTVLQNLLSISQSLLMILPTFFHFLWVPFSLSLSLSFSLPGEIRPWSERRERESFFSSDEIGLFATLSERSWCCGWRSYSTTDCGDLRWGCPLIMTTPQLVPKYGGSAADHW